MAMRTIGLGGLYEARRLTTLGASHRLIEIDYPVRPRVRHGCDRPPHPQLHALLAAHEDWYDRRYSEQYLLACWLLGGDNLQVELPVGYLSHAPTPHATLQALWDDPALARAGTYGGAFWFSVAAQRT
jgi:hypothetical protein